MMTKENLIGLLEIAKNAALRAGNYILNHSITQINVNHKLAGSSLASQLFTEVDLESERLIRESLSDTFERFQLGWLAEEGSDNGSRLEKPYFWSVDPLDGTLPFVNGEAGYAVSIALVSNAGEALIGVVFDPVMGDLYHAAKGKGAYLNGKQIGRNTLIDNVFHLYIDRSFHESSRFPLLFEVLTQKLPNIGCKSIETHVGAGAVMNGCMALRRGKSAYFKFPKPSAGGGSLWDFSAISAIYKEVGCYVSDIYGNSLDLNRVDSTFINHRGVLFCTDEDVANIIKEIYCQEKSIFNEKL